MSREYEHGIQRRGNSNDKHTKKCLTPLVIKKMKNKTRYDLNPIKLAKIKSSEMPSIDENVEKL